MGLFQYCAIDSRGKKVKGIIDAENIEEAKETLDVKKIIVTKLELKGTFKKKISISKKDVLNFTEDISRLLSAGISLYDVLIILKDKYEKHKMYSIVLDLCDQIKRGINFSDALSCYPNFFDFLYCSMIANAEKTGTLKEAIAELVQMLKKQYLLKRKLFGALLYPAILSVFCFVVIFSLIFFVVPSLSELFEGKNLHPLTKIVLTISFYANATKEYIILFFVSFLSLIITCFCVVSWRGYLHKKILTFPIIKKFMIKVALIRFCRSFSVLLESSVSYVEALNLAKKVMKHPVLENDITWAQNSIVEGKKISDALEQRKNIPALMIRLLKIAEESAKTSEMLGHISEIYEDDLDKNLSQLTSLLQPILLLFLGLVVCFIVLAVLLPLTDISSFIN